MAAKDLKSAFNKNRINTSLETGSLGVVGVSNNVREELERNTENIPVQEIPINQLEDNPFQNLARSSTDQALSREALQELAASIQQNGFYGSLVARPRPGSNKGQQPPRFELAYGHRRRSAAQFAGLKTLPVKILELTDNQMARIMASENFSREDLTPLGEANVVGMLYTTQNLSADKIAEVIGKTRRWVQIRLDLYEAPQDIKEMTERKHDTLTYVPILKQLKDFEQRKELIEAILTDQLTREQLRSTVERLKQPNPTSPANSVKSVTILTPGANSDKIRNPSTPDLEYTETEAAETEVATEPLSSSWKNGARGTGNSFSDAEKNTQKENYSEALRELERAVSKLEKLANHSNSALMSKDEQGQLAKLAQRINNLIG